MTTIVRSKCAQRRFYQRSALSICLCRDSPLPIAMMGSIVMTEATSSEGIVVVRHTRCFMDGETYSASA